MPSDSDLAQPDSSPAFMTVAQVAVYLSLNQKSIYALAKDRKLPGTKVTGKWMFPRELVDRWLLESSHSGVLTDRLIVAGSEDPLLHRIVDQYGHDLGPHGLIMYGPTGTRLGLDLLQANRVDVCCMHWGPAGESERRHPALLRQYSAHHDWVLIHGFRREQGLMLARQHAAAKTQPQTLIGESLRWVMQHEGSGSQRFLREILARAGDPDKLPEAVARVNGEREAAATIAMGVADVAPGSRASAVEFGLEFVPFGWESFELVMSREVYFRRMLQALLKQLVDPAHQVTASQLGGYDLSDCGKIMFGAR